MREKREKREKKKRKRETESWKKEIRIEIQMKKLIKKDTLASAV